MVALPSRDTPRIIKGVILKFVDGRWNDGDDCAPPDELMVMGITRALQCWRDKTPVDTLVERPGEPLPDVNELNAQIPKKEWDLGLDGQPRPPWQLNHVVYLIDPTTADTFTYLNSTTGARIAVERLQDKFRWMRALRGSNVVPIVKLDSRPMKTKFGTKMRPEFAVSEWREIDRTSEALAQIEPPRTNPPASNAETAATQPAKKADPGKSVTPVTLKEEVNDEIRY
jgi:hypothetical protein